MKFFVGFDSAHPEAAEKCAKSISRFIGHNNVEMIDTSALRAKGLYWRVHNGTESTDFTYSRFLTPYLSSYSGMAVFCDGDFIWKRSPYELMDQHGRQLDDKSYSVHVVQHEITPDMLTSTKMDGKIQKWYPKKNWSSLMVFNCEHPDLRALTPHAVSYAAPSWLHGFKWTEDHKIGALHRKFNHLVGYYDSSNAEEIVAVHYTDGGPWLDNYRDVEFAEEWYSV